MLSFDPRIGKVQIGQTTHEFIVISTNKKLQHNFFFFFKKDNATYSYINFQTYKQNVINMLHFTVCIISMYHLVFTWLLFYYLGWFLSIIIIYELCHARV